MKKILFLCIMITLTGLFSIIHAQNTSEISDKALSAQYKYEIELLNAEIKTLKVKLKGEPQNIELRSELTVKQEQLKEVKGKKKIMDNSIKSQAAAEKAARKAENASIKAEQARQKAQRLKESERY